MNLSTLFFITVMYPFSPLTFLIFHDKLANDCNDVVSAQVLQVTAVNMFQCEVDLFIPDYNRYTSYPIPCASIVSHNFSTGDTCAEPRDNDPIKVMLNHYDSDSCFKIVMANEDKYVTPYTEIYWWYNVAKIEAIIVGLTVFVGIIAGIAQ